MTEKSPQERNAFVRQHARSISGTSQRAGSISSDGIVDEEDDEPFSATNSAVVASGPNQDVLPKRPQPGGRFPSQVSVSSARGLQAPLSPSSGSSGFGDVQDRDVVAAAAAGALAGSGLHHYGEDASSPSHAAYVDQQAKEDGINPYTYQRMSQDEVHNQPDHQFPKGASAGGISATGLDGAAIGASGSEVYRHHEDEKAAYRKQQEEQAAREASTIAAPDTYQQQSEQQAAREAAFIAAPDNALHPIPSDTRFMSGGRSQGDLNTGDVVTSDAYPNQSTVGSHSRDVSNQLETLLTDEGRPLLAAGQNHRSVQSISQLHVPGEFPGDSTKSKDTLGPEGSL